MDDAPVWIFSLIAWIVLLAIGLYRKAPEQPKQNKNRTFKP